LRRFLTRWLRVAVSRLRRSWDGAGKQAKHKGQEENDLDEMTKIHITPCDPAKTGNRTIQDGVEIQRSTYLYILKYYSLQRDSVRHAVPNV
jgi:hypothetical protein